MTPQTILTITSLVIALAAFIVSASRYRLTARNMMRPVLVFSRNDVGTWDVKNVGNGAAINVEIYDGGTSYVWVRRAICSPLLKEEKHNLPWVKKGRTLGANFTDSDGRKYSTKCNAYKNNVSKGHFNTALEAEYEFDLTFKLNEVGEIERIV